MGARSKSRVPNTGGICEVVVNVGSKPPHYPPLLHWSQSQAFLLNVSSSAWFLRAARHCTLSMGGHPCGLLLVPTMLRRAWRIARSPLEPTRKQSCHQCRRTTFSLAHGRADFGGGVWSMGWFCPVGQQRGWGPAFSIQSSPAATSGSVGPVFHGPKNPVQANWAVHNPREEGQLYCPYEHCLFVVPAFT